ncbi:MAG: hypothetical protein PHP04_02595 [Bacteroidales bacterium]|nr:hypothetical protein [Bacteroidales bacterium]
MILTDYYRGEHLPDAAKTRFDVTASTGSYEPFETKLRTRQGGLSFYFGDVPERFRFSGKDRPDKAITKGDNISSVFVPDITLPFAFGDIHHTTDAIILIFSNDWQVIEIFIARGQRNNKRNLYHLLCDGELDSEIEILRNNAKK